MILKKLDIYSFGKFHDRHITLNKGLNIIKGENEAGKSTLHKFIEGIFYGFFRPYSKNKLYSPDYEKYRPWSSGAYRGAIEYTALGKDYRLERDFSKASESVKLIDSRTGDDITPSLAYDSVLRLPKANRHMAISKEMFTNSVFIPQSGSITDEALSREIGEMLTNTAGTHSGSFSVNRSIERLNSRRNAIGTRKQTRSPLGSCVVKIKNLEEELISSLAHEEMVSEKRKKLAALEIKQQSLKKEYEAACDKEENERIAEAGRICGALAELEREEARYNEKLASLAVIDEADISAFNELKTKRKLLFAQMEESRKAVSGAEVLVAKAVALCRSKHDEYDSLIAQAATDENALKAASAHLAKKMADEVKKEEARETNENTGENEASLSVYEDVKRYQNQEKVTTIAGLILVTLSLIFTACGYFIDIFYYYLSIASAVICMGVMIYWFSISKKRESAQKEYDESKEEQAPVLVTDEQTDTHSKTIAELLKKYSVENIGDLHKIFAKREEIRSSLKLLDEKKANLNIEADKEKKIYLSDKAEYVKAENEFSALLKKYECNSEEAFNEKAEHAAERKLLQEKINSCSIRRSDLTNGKDLNELVQAANRVATRNFIVKNMDETRDKGEITAELNKINEEAASIRGSLSASDETIRSSAEVRDEIDEYNKKITVYEDDIASVNLAVATIEKLSQNIRYDFSDAFNSCVSETVKKVTMGKYENVIVNEKMDILVEDTYTHRYASVTDLSTGTVELMYFAVRFAVADLIVEDKTVPVFLDDCFVNYDEKRLESVLMYLAEEAKSRQIIVMSCRNAEAAILKKNNISYNLITL